jgi:hypothetical protein
MNKVGKEGEDYRTSCWISVLGYWLCLAVACPVSVAYGASGWGALAFILSQALIVLPASWLSSGLSATKWYKAVAFCGVRRLGYAMTKRGRTNINEPAWWEAPFVFYWGFCIQYLTPALLWFVIIGSMVDDIESPYDGLIAKWQAPGIFVPAFGFFLFFIGCIFCVDEVS